MQRHSDRGYVTLRSQHATSGAASLSPDAPRPAEQPMLARWPICDAQRRVRGYEIQGPATTRQEIASVHGEDQSCRLIHAIANVIGIDVVAESGQFVIMPASAAALAQHLYLSLPAGRSVLMIDRIPSNDDPDPKEWSDVHRRGYALGARHDWERPVTVPRPGITFLRVDMADRSEQLLADTAAAARAAGCRIIASGVNDRDMAACACRAGCDLLTGRFFTAPDIAHPHEISGAGAVHVRLLTHISHEPLDRDTVAHIIASDLALSQALLRRANASSNGVRRKIASIAHALALLGDEHLRAWAAVTALASLKGASPDELIILGLVRARFCSRLVRECGHQSEAQSAYLIGLFSTIDALLGVPMEQAVAMLGLAENIAAALVGDRSGHLGMALSLVDACEHGAWATAYEMQTQLNLTHSAVTMAYYDAMSWARRQWKGGGSGAEP